MCRDPDEPPEARRCGAILKPLHGEIRVRTFTPTTIRFHTPNKTALLTDWDLRVEFQAVYFGAISQSHLEHLFEDYGVRLARGERDSHRHEHRSVFITEQRNRRIYSTDKVRCNDVHDLNAFRSVYE